MFVENHRRFILGFFFIIGLYPCNQQRTLLVTFSSDNLFAEGFRVNDSVVVRDDVARFAVQNLGRLLLRGLVDL